MAKSTTTTPLVDDTNTPYCAFILSVSSIICGHQLWGILSISRSRQYIAVQQLNLGSATNEFQMNPNNSLTSHSVLMIQCTGRNAHDDASFKIRTVHSRCDYTNPNLHTTLKSTTWTVRGVFSCSSITRVLLWITWTAYTDKFTCLLYIDGCRRI